MKLYIENIGMIKNGEIEVNKLNVIAGINGTGKSTIGKVLFILIKSFNRELAQKEIVKNKKEELNKYLKKIYDDLLNQYNFKNSSEFVGIDLRLMSRINIISNNVIMDLSKIKIPLEKEPEDEVKKVTEDEVKKVTEDVIKKLIEMVIYKSTGHDIKYYENNQSLIIKKKKLEKISEEEINRIAKEIKRIVLETRNFKDIFKERFLSYCDAVFGNNISNVYTDSKSTIRLCENNKTIFETILEKNRIISFEIYKELPFNDVTIVESSSLLQVQNLIKNATGKFEIRQSREYVFIDELVNDYTKDFINKLCLVNKQDYNDEVNISSIIDGKVYYNDETNGFEFINSDEYKFPIENVATGIKDFGILQMILEKGLLNEKSLLVLDEPENGLHPEWQLEYAKLISKLIKNKMNILITTHSLFMVQALNYYLQEDKKEKNKVKFYSISKEDNHNSKIEDATNYLDVIINRMASPLDKIM